MNQSIQVPVAHVPTLETVGTAYNAICPRMDATIQSEPMTGPGYLPRGKLREACEIFGIEISTARNAALVCRQFERSLRKDDLTFHHHLNATPERGPFVTKTPPAWHALPICGLVTIGNSTWEPLNSRDLPPSPTQGMGMELSAQFAIAYNQSQFVRQRRRWAVVTNRGTCLILTGIPAEQRPLNPCDFPPCVEQRLTFPEVEAIADQQNADRFKLARIPRTWTVGLRRADQVNDTPIGGAV